MLKLIMPSQLAEPVLTAEWVTTNYISYHYHRSVQRVRTWCVDGTLIDFGFSVYQDHLGRWWIKCPQSVLSSN